MTQPSAPIPADAVVFNHGVPQPAYGHPRDEAGRAAWVEALEGVEHGMSLPPEEEVTLGEPNCQRCEVLPRPLRGPGTLQLRFGHTHTLGKALATLAAGRWTHVERNGTVSVSAPAGSLAPLLDAMSSVEQRDSRAAFVPEGVPPGPADRFEVQDLPGFVARSRGDWVLDILRAKRLYSVFQPILRCPANGERDVYGYECLARADVEGRTVSPGTMFDLARGAGFLFQLDLAARRAAITGAADHGIASKVFVNFTPNAIYNPFMCLSSTVRMVDEKKLDRGRVVFEIVETEKLPEMTHLKRIVKKYRDDGFEVALDDVGSGYSSMEVLLELRPDYVKLDMGLIRGVHADAGKALVTSKLLEVAQGLKAKTVAEGVETEEELAWVRSRGVDFVQGYLFAKPATPPPAVGA